MTKTNDTLSFRISSGLKSLIGRDLISDKYIAVFELVKNSYDAGASKVEISYLVSEGIGKIIISDNGSGMTYDDIIKKWLFAICAIILMNGCAPLRMPVIVRNAPIEMYKYAYISPTKELTSSIGGTYGGQYGIYGSSTTKSVNPSDVIAGILIKEGYIILPELKPELSNETLIVNYGESGRRNRGLGYTIEVTIQFSSAKTNEMICSCTAEGQGETEADDIRQAIRRALTSLFPEK